MLSILISAAFDAPKFFEFKLACFKTNSSAFSCKDQSNVVYIFNHHTLTISFQYFSSKYSLT
ncbi:MAG: hypothetical protein Q8S84_04590 [bacterium]|nr:hypothetical protein [bacterium]